MANLYSTAESQYTSHKANLSSKDRRAAELSSDIVTKGAINIALFCLAALEGSSSKMVSALTELAVIYNTTIDSPTLSLAGVATEYVTNEQAVTAGSNVIAFPLAMSSTSYALNITCLATDGNQNSFKYDRASKTVNGFTIEVAEAGYINYVAYLI